MIRKKRIEKKPKEPVITTVYLPVESYGICINEQCPKHKSKTEVILGDGYCQKCFDKLCGPGFEKNGGKKGKKNGGKKGKKKRVKKKVVSTRCPECDQPCNDDRVKAGMKCGACSYA